MIKDEEVFYIGYIQKFRGLQGEVEMIFTDDPFDRGSSPYLVFNIDGINIPFFFEYYKFKNQDTVILKFENINSDTEAKALVGTKVYYPTAHLDDEEEQELSSLKALTGYTVYDATAGELGVITEVYDAKENPLFYIEDNDGQELVIPYHDDFLVDYNLKERTITLSVPEGILEL